MAEANLGNLEGFISEVAETCAAYETNNSKMDDQQSEIDKLEDEAEDLLNTLTGDVKKFNDDFTQSHAETVSGLEELIQTLSTMIDQRLAEVIDTFQQIGDDVDQDASTHRDGLEGEFNDLEQEGYKHVEDGVDHCENQVTEIGNEAQQNFTDMEHHVDDLKNNTSQLKDHTMQIFGAVATNVSDTLSEAVSSGMDAFTGGLNTGLSTLTGGMDDVMGLLDSGFNLFNQGFDGLGDHLMEQGGEILSNALTNITDNLMQHMEQAFINLCEQAIQGLVEQVIEHLITMGVGQAITTATAPYAPIIIAAYEVLRIIDAILSALGGL